MQIRFVILGAVLSVVVSSWLALPAQEDVAAEVGEPQRTDLVEETGRRLVQLDVTVTGPRESIAGLTREDFEVSVAARPVESFTVDNLCRLPDESTPVRETPEAVEPEAEAPTPVPGPRASYLFYFEQNNLTLQGRVKALDIARELVGELIADGNRGMVISSGRDLRTFVDLTEDPDALIEGIDRLQEDLQHWWDPTLESEETRIQQVLEKLSDDHNAAIGMARMYQAEERWRTEKSLQLFSLVLARMADLNAPKAVVYFADNMRSNAGEHYLSYFGERDRRNLTSFTAAHAFDKVLEEANALGIRVYTVQAQGLVAETSDARFLRRSPGGAAGDRVGNTQRYRDAESSLVGLALETGGKHFIRGRPAIKIAEEIRDDLSCLYLISFDPRGLRLDSPLPLLVRALPPKVKTRVRGRVVVHSESQRLTSRLLAAFAAGDGGENDVSLRGTVIPTGFDEGRFSALVQVHVPGSPLSSTEWDLGLSLVSRGSVREDASGRVIVNGPGMPVVFETQMTFKPGPYEIVTVAHETTSDDVASARVEGEWPDPDEAAVSVGPIAVVQPESGAFLRDANLRRTGSLALGDDGLARPDRPTALVSIICRARSTKKPFVVERKLTGESSVEFAPMEMDLGKDRCAVFRDLIKADTMTDGGFEYGVRVVRGDEELAVQSREFLVVSKASEESTGS